MSVYMIFMFLVCVSSRVVFGSSRAFRDICLLERDVTKQFCTCMTVHEFKETCCIQAIQEPLKEDLKDLKARERTIIELQEKGDFYCTLLIISGTLNSLFILVVIKILVTRAYLKSNQTKNTETTQMQKRLYAV
ncbi:uncharacterized protein LOC132717381 [Ruditapes philippinarum]|uniref:uncharacterized protein LOC132717381 n=1 Tax=Ruditapes philippinarum TaxID=129788 RepID=UPI00295AC2AB|nr:uncharacterized protein LOC132717381 [Ruditapes philippinarum]